MIELIAYHDQSLLLSLTHSFVLHWIGRILVLPSRNQGTEVGLFKQQSLSRPLGTIFWLSAAEGWYQ